MVPCNTCHGCIKAHAQAWAFRCHLEATRQPNNAFATLTFDEDHVPFTLDWKRDGQPFLKSLRQRSTLPLRFFASGEYGERTQRPHYHFLLFGLNALGAASQTMVQKSWGKGQVRLDHITPARIAYVAGYTAKKTVDRFNSIAHCDPETGEAWQPPFIQMSRKPGLGSHARQWKNSWRLFAIHQGNKLPVPRYLHQAWRDTATEQELQELQAEKEQYNTNRDTKNLLGRIKAQEQIALTKQKRAAERRYL